MDPLSFNRKAWDRQVEQGNVWTKPDSPEVIAAARHGHWSLLLTPSIPVPAEWYPPIQGCRVLCLACGGGQQGPILAAAGAQVTVLDNSPAQLAQDRLVAEREGLELATVQGDMADLSAFADGSFDLIFHPVSNVFVPKVLPVWREAYRVLGKGGSLLAGINNPIDYIFDFKEMDKGNMVVSHSLPYSDIEAFSPEELAAAEREGTPLEWSHTLDEQLGGQMQAGFVLSGFYEDADPNEFSSRYFKGYLATRALKL